MPKQEEMAAIPLVEERLSIAKRQVESGRVQVRVNVRERDERVPIELAHDEVKVERVPKNIPILELPLVRMEGNTTIIPVVEEEVVVERRLVLVEEIHVQRLSTTTTQEVQLRVRSEEASIERDEVSPGADAAREVR